MPGLPSSFVALDTVTGRSEIIDHQDVLNLPSERPVEPKFSLHDAMEVKLGLSAAPRLTRHPGQQ